MDVYWILAEDDDASHTLEAVSRQLREGDRGDPELAEALRTLRFDAWIDDEEVVVSKRPFFGAALTGFRRLLVKALWWYGLPQWGQVTRYQHATSRVLDVVLAEQRRLRERIAALEAKVPKRDAGA
jgi:hypothetical protein